MILEDPSHRFQSMGDVIAGIDLTLTKLSGRPSGDGEHQLVFMFGAPGGDRYSGDPPTADDSPSWLPRTSRSS